ncbi:MAG: GNAT family N-acetyltransferase [Acidobacteria bacterium]|nr:GNAT family N-acetyltransferase [Acidobacteriota bacterium]
MNSSESWLQPRIHVGESVRLEPLVLDHVDAIWAVADFDDLWTWMPYRMTCRDDVAEMVAQALEWPATDWGQAFVQVAVDAEKVCGMTCYLNADAANRRVEIGGTWITSAFQRTRVNTEAKLLLLRDAFGQLGAKRVEWKTDSANARSRAAIARLGATEEGTLRNHMIRPDGTMRHSTYFSVIREEWPGVEQRLQRLLAGRPARA